MNAVDTNVLIYCHDPKDSKKQGLALSLISRLEDGCLLWQVCCEFLAASRKLVPLGFRLDLAFQEISLLSQAWSVYYPSICVLGKARELSREFSFWDALLIASCLEGHISVLYSEDFGNRKIGSLELINPFQ